MPLPLAPLPALAPLPPLGALPGLAPAVPMAPYQRIGQPLFTPGIIPFLSLIMPLMVLPKLFEDPGRVIAGFTLRPILQGNQFSGLMRSMMMNGQDPRERDQLIRDMMLPTALFVQGANAISQAAGLHASNAGAAYVDQEPPPQPKSER